MKHSISQAVAIWDRALATIKPRLNDRNLFEQFFQNTYVDSISDTEMIINCETAVAARVLETSFKKVIRDALGNDIDDCVSLVFVHKALEDKENEKTPQNRSFFADSLINKNFTFDNFVVGPSNREAYQGALMIASSPGTTFNPLLIYSDSGLGKTHLLHAIGNAIHQKSPALKVLYVTAHDFLDEYVRYIREDRDGEDLKAFIKRSVDVLLVDDIQFLVQKKKTEEMFFAVFQTLYNAGKQIVITSDQYPANLDGLDERLKSRFVQGLSVSISRPTKETCEAIIRSKIVDAGLEISSFDPEVIAYLSAYFFNNVRELEGAVNHLIFYSRGIEHKDYVDLKTAIDAMKTMADSNADSNALSIQKVINVVSEYYNLTSDQLISKTRTAQIALARHVAMYLCRVLLDVPYKKIGNALGGRDHATVISGIQNVEKMLKDDPSAEGVIKHLSNKIKPEKSI